MFGSGKNLYSFPFSGQSSAFHVVAALTEAGQTFFHPQNKLRIKSLIKRSLVYQLSEELRYTFQNRSELFIFFTFDHMDVIVICNVDYSMRGMILKERIHSS